MIKSRDSASLLETIAVDSTRDESFRHAALISLGEIASTTSTSALLKVMAAADKPQLRVQAIDSFFRVRGKGGIIELLEAKASEKEPGVNAHYAWYVELCKRGETFSPPAKPGTAGEGSFEGTRYFRYIPSTYNAETPHKVLVAIHGTEGSADLYLEICQKFAERKGIILIVPWLNLAQFPTFDNLNLANTAIGAPRADLRVLNLIDAACEGLSADTERLYLFGHSRGGQFVQRFVFAHPDRIARAAACGSGLYLSPDPEIVTDYGPMFPYGVLPNPFAPDLSDRTMKALAGVPVAIVVGSEDTRRSMATDFIKQAESVARRDGYPLNFELIIVPGGKHSGADNFPAAAEFLFDR
jgi:pimeloyl-ACP methyl ester carboxylesterase